MRANLNTSQGIILLENEIRKLKAKKCIVEIKEVREDRTLTQNAARWLYLKMVADELCERGDTFQVTDRLEAKYTKELLYELVWRSLHTAMYPNKKRLNTKEFSEVADTAVLFFSSKMSIDIPFPSIDNV